MLAKFIFLGFFCASWLVGESTQQWVVVEGGNTQFFLFCACLVCSSSVPCHLPVPFKAVPIIGWNLRSLSLLLIMLTIQSELTFLVRFDAKYIKNDQKLLSLCADSFPATSQPPETQAGWECWGSVVPATRSHPSAPSPAWTQSCVLHPPECWGVKPTWITR